MMKTARGRDLNYLLAIRRARRRSRLRALLLGVAVLSAGIWVLATRDRRARLRDIDERRVVILPFDNRTGDASLDALGAVAADWTTRLLTFFRHTVDVVPATTTLAYYRSTNLVVHELRQRAELLAIGVRAQRVAWGTFYSVGDSLRFDVYVSDIVESGEPRLIARLLVPAAAAMQGVDSVAKQVALALLRVPSLQQVAALKPPRLQPYSAFVTGLDFYAQGDYRAAATHFSDAARDSHVRRFQIWLADALMRDRQFARADSVIAQVQNEALPLSDAERAYMVAGRLHGDWQAVHLGVATLVERVRADDLAALDFALAALALNRPRQARRILLEQHPDRGALRARPDFYLHLAAAHHLAGEHDRERRTARRAIFTHPTSIEAKLALCRAEAARADEADAREAVDRLAAISADQGATITTAEALRDCTAELHFHGLPDVAQYADHLANLWERRRPFTPPVQRDTVYERAHLAFDDARAAAARGDIARAMEQLWFALESGLPYYEPGRPLLHAEPAFSRLRNTRGFIRINQPQG